jgi:hypothetical protein
MFGTIQHAWWSGVRLFISPCRISFDASQMGHRSISLSTKSCSEWRLNKHIQVCISLNTNTRRRVRAPYALGRLPRWNWRTMYSSKVSNLSPFRLIFPIRSRKNVEITIILVEIAVAWTSRHPPQILSNPFKAHPPINVAITTQKHHPPCENTRCMELLSWWTSQFTSRHGPAVQTSKSMLDSTWRSAHKNIILRLYNASAARID